MAPAIERHCIVESSTKPRKIARGIVSSKERILKRKYLHDVIRRLIQGPFEQPELEPESYHDVSNQSTDSIADDGLLYPEVELTCSEEDVHSNDGSNGYCSASSTHPSELEHPAFGGRRRANRRPPAHMSQLSEAGCAELNVPNIPLYHSNMARSFPEGQMKTPQQKRRRDVNTLTARRSRAKTRAMEELLKKEASEAEQENSKRKGMLAISFAYASELMEKLELAKVDFHKLWKAENDHASLQTEQPPQSAPMDEDESSECKNGDELPALEELGYASS